MSKFKDAEGDTWKIRITLGTVKKIHADTGINITKFLDDQMALASDVFSDGLKFVAVLFSILEPQLDKAKIDENEFAERLYGDSLDDAKTAVWDAYLDFCPSQQREVLQTLMAKTEELQQETKTKLMSMEMKDLISFEQHTETPASSESIPTRSRHAK